ncbi:MULTISPECIES: efflux transporter outer membrane subunit [unclassified Lentimonas]|uniref:efflux transporter outer membrane subunit n=1 Tax=unclassified Lentimonas TaxID=2630993 RepID=UPI001A7EE15A|nr:MULTISPECIES: efflux transporter outer membrane subunit [unclassified Lentimonas]
MRFKYCIPLISLWLGGCMIGPDYEKPEESSLQVPEHYYVEDGASDDASVSEDSLALKEWRAVYKDPYLVGLIREALDESLDMAAAQSRLRQAYELIGVSRAALFPWLDGGLNSNAEQATGSHETDETYTAAGLLSWELDVWGIQRREIEAAQALAIQAELDVNAVQVSLIGTIAVQYFNLLSIDHQLSVTQSTIDTRREALRILELRKESGVISGVEVSQAEVSLAQAERKLPELKQAQFEIETILSVLLGRAPGEIVRGELLMDIEVPDELPVGMPSDLLLRRPDVRGAEMAMVAANAKVGIAEGRLYPRFKLTGEFGYESDKLGDLLDRGTDFFDFDANMTAPIFNAGANKANLAAEKEAYEQSLISYKKIVLNALQEVSNVLSGYQQAQLQEAADRKLLVAAQKYNRLALLQYRGGVLGYIDVLDAQRQLFDAELSVTQSRRDRLQALASLYRVLGGGWDPQSVAVK